MDELNGYRIHPEVVCGESGQLFISGWNHRIEQFVLGKETPEASSFENFDANLAERRKFCESIGAEFIHIVCPDKQTVYRDAYPVEQKAALGDLYREACKGQFLYPVEDLRTGNTYYRTDSHWNWHGAMIATGVILNAIGISGEAIKERKALVTTKDYIGDLGTKLTPKQHETIEYFKERNEKLQFSNENVRNMGLMRIFINIHAKNNARLLIFGDSFLAHCLTYFSDVFKYVLFVRSPYLHQELLFSFKPTHVITGNAERYLSHISSDQNAENVFLWPLMLGLDFNRNNKFYAVLSGLTGASRKPLESEITSRALELAQAGNKEAAMAIVDGWLSHEALTEDMAITKSKIAMLLGQNGEAVKIAVEAVNAFNRSPKTLCHAGAYLINVGRFEEAEQYFSEAAQRSKTGHVAHRGKARALQKLGRLHEALKAAEEAVIRSKNAADVVALRDEIKALLR